MAEMITRCPKCATAFRITLGHLRSARGSVRCGSCLQVFNAREHLTESSLAALAKANEEPKAPAAKPAARVPAEPVEPDHDDILISDDMDFDDEEASIDSDDLFPPEPAPTQTTLFEHATSGSSADEEDEEDEDDESWALKLLDDDPTPIDNLRVQPAAVPDTFTIEQSDYDLDEEDYRDEPQEFNDRTGPTIAEDPALPPTVEGEDTDTSEPQSLAVTPRETTRGRTYLDAIEPEPMEFAVRPEKPFWRSQILWIGLSLLALLLFAAQIAWLQYPALNRIEPYRGFYEIACDALGCQLPPQEDLEAIRTSNLVVRSHPREGGALMVDVVLQNTAPFTQPFPALELTFSDLNSNLVARRRFSPHDYLGGELAGESKMPAKQPVHIALEIVDPGADAVNYRIEVVGTEG